MAGDLCSIFTSDWKIKREREPCKQPSLIGAEMSTMSVSQQHDKGMLHA